MSGAVHFSAAHCRAARALLDLTQAQLAEMAEVGRMTVKRFEAEEQVRPAQAGAIRRALESAGVTFLYEGAEIGGRAVLCGVVKVDGDGAKD